MKQSRTVEDNLISVIALILFFFLFLKLQMHASVQKLIEIQLTKTSHLYAKQAFPG